MPYMQNSSCADMRQDVTIHALYEPTGINNVTRSTGINTLHIICMCLWTNMSATMKAPLSCFCSLHRPHITAYITQQQECNIYFTSIAIHVPATNLVIKCQIYATHSIYYTCGFAGHIPIYMPHEVTCNYNHHVSTLQTMMHGTVIFPWKNMATTLQIYVPLNCYWVYIKSPITAHISQNINIVQHLFHMLL